MQSPLTPNPHKLTSVADAIRQRAADVIRANADRLSIVSQFEFRPIVRRA